MSAELSEETHPKLRSAESQERFNEKIKEAFLMAGDREPIGEVLSYLASVGFEDGMGKDQAARQIIASDVFKRKGLAEGPLRACIRHEIEAAYGDKKGRRKFSSDQKSAARQELDAFLADMKPHHSVTGFFRDLTHGRTSAGPVLTDSVSDTVSKGGLLHWATGRRTTEVIKRRFKGMVQPVIAAKYREYIKSKPREYIVNFLNDVFVFQMIGDPPNPHAEFKIGNLRELFLDITDAVDFETFWSILSDHAEASCSELKSIPATETAMADFFNIDLWKSSIELIWQQAASESARGSAKPRAIERTRTAVRREVGAVVNKIFFVILPQGDNGTASSKITIEIQDRTGRRIGRALVKPTINNTPPDQIRRFVHTLLTGPKSGVARILRTHRIFLEKNGPEVEALADQLGNGQRRSKR